MPGGVGEQVPELDSLPADPVEVLQDAQGDLPVGLAEVAADVVGAEASIASGAGWHEIGCEAKQLGNVHGHILRLDRRGKRQASSGVRSLSAATKIKWIPVEHRPEHPGRRS